MKLEHNFYTVLVPVGPDKIEITLAMTLGCMLSQHKYSFSALLYHIYICPATVCSDCFNILIVFR